MKFNPAQKHEDRIVSMGSSKVSKLKKTADNVRTKLSETGVKSQLSSFIFGNGENPLAELR